MKTIKQLMQMDIETIKEESNKAWKYLRMVDSVRDFRLVESGKDVM